MHYTVRVYSPRTRRSAPCGEHRPADARRGARGAQHVRMLGPDAHIPRARALLERVGAPPPPHVHLVDASKFLIGTNLTRGGRRARSEQLAVCDSSVRSCDSIRSVGRR